MMHYKLFRSIPQEYPITHLYHGTHIPKVVEATQWPTFEIKGLENPRIVSNQNVLANLDLTLDLTWIETMNGRQPDFDSVAQEIIDDQVFIR